MRWSLHGEWGALWVWESAVLKWVHRARVAWTLRKHGGDSGRRRDLGGHWPRGLGDRQSTNPGQCPLFLLRFLEKPAAPVRLAEQACSLAAAARIRQMFEVALHNGARLNARLGLTFRQFGTPPGPRSRTCQARSPTRMPRGLVGGWDEAPIVGRCYHGS